MLATPPVAAIRYVKDSKGLEPSEYGGGGSLSSASLLDDRSFESGGSAALISAAAMAEGDDSCCGIETDDDAGAQPESIPSWAVLRASGKWRVGMWSNGGAAAEVILWSG